MTIEKKMPTMGNVNVSENKKEEKSNKLNEIVNDNSDDNKGGDIQENSIISKLQEQIDDLKKQNSELERKLIYVASEYENSKRRNAKDLDDMRKFAVSKFATETVGLFDVLQKAVENIDEKKTDKVLFEGVKMTISEFEKIFEKMQISKIDPEVGSVFDHNKQEAISRVSSELEAGLIVQVIRCGYELYGRLLRPAMVVVSGGK